jgi:menaquinone-dependent protoporphyrinogen oxidase
MVLGDCRQSSRPTGRLGGSVMNVLVLYSSTEGQTRKVAEWIASHVEAAGHQAALADMGAEGRGPSVPAFDTVIVAASVHQGYHQESAASFVTAHLAELEQKPSAFISLSLSAAMDGGQAEAQGYIDRFLETTGWRPRASLALAGAIRLSAYDYFERQVMKYIVMQKGVAHDLNVDYECTDWLALEKFVDSFLGLAARKGGADSGLRSGAPC